MLKFYLLILCLFPLALILNAQTIRINELMSSNSGVLLDSDGDAPDWIELYNAGSSMIDLNGYALSDKADQLNKWVFPDYQMNAGEYLVVFASGKDRKETPMHWNTIISSGDTWKYLVPVSEPASNWRLIGFDDSSWQTGKSGFGFGDNDDATVLLNARTIFLRKTFSIIDTAAIRQLMFNMDYDDGFVAYINGVEIARSQMDNRGAFPPFNVYSSGQHEALIYQGLPPESFNVSYFASLLKKGENILSVQVHNSDSSSSDLTAIPFLSIATNENFPDSRTVDILGLKSNYFHTDFKISADGESIFLTDPQGAIADSVRVGALATNTSYGRTIDDPSVWGVFVDSTPGKENTGDVFSPGSLGVPIFSRTGGIYSTTGSITISSPDKNDTVFYTLDGSEPNHSSLKAVRQIDILTSKVVRARLMRSGMMPGPIVDNSYIIYDNKQLPVVSLAVNPVDLWDYNTGIYVLGPNAEAANPNFGANFWQDWEKACHIEIFESTGQRVIDLDAGVKIFGNWSRANAQKSLAIHTRKSYGPDQFEYKFFKDKPIDEFKNIVLRNSGNDWNNSMFRDGLSSGLTIGLNFDQMAFRPAILFLNGEYWGIQNIREKIDEHFIASNDGVNPDDVIMLENFGDTLLGGTDGGWRKLYDFVNSHSLTTESNYNEVASQIDMSSFIDYYSTQIFLTNWDWPGNNIRYWKTTDPASKWRYIMYDTDFSLGIWGTKTPSENSLAAATDPNGPGWPNPPWSTLFLRKLLENTGFRNQFVNRFADLLNSTLLPERINKAIDEKRDAINDEIGNHLKRWSGGNQSSWLTIVQAMKTFVNARPYNVFIHIQQKFGFQTPKLIYVNADSIAGSVQLNSLKLTAFPWHGSYFQDVPITLTAIPHAGYRFLRWDGITANSSSKTITVSPAAKMNLIAVFENDGTHYDNIVINEISFNNAADPDPGDWVEIYNKGTQDIDISGWKLTDLDSTHVFVIAPNTWIKANDYLVVSNDLTKMKSVFGEVKNLVGPFEFGLGSMTDAVKLFSNYNELIDEVDYSNVYPWKTFDLTKLWSLELTNPSKNNNSGSNWDFSVQYGTPGMRNSQYIPDAIQQLIMPQDNMELSQNYPNPFTDGTYIEFRLNQAGKYRLSVLDINGQIIRELNDDDQFSANHSVYWDGKNESGKTVASGVYFYRLESNGTSEMKRMVKM